MNLQAQPVVEIHRPLREFTFGRRALAIDARPHAARRPHFEFPIIQITESATCKPETSDRGEFYTSDPKQLHDLSKYLCPHAAYQRSTKMQIDSEGWTDEMGTPIYALETDFRWIFKDTPGGALNIQNGVRKTFITGDDQMHGSSYIGTVTNEYPLGTDANDNEIPILEYVNVERKQRDNGEVYFTTETTDPLKRLIRISLNPFRASDGTSIHKWNDASDEEIKWCIFQVNPVEATLQPDGFAYFINDPVEVGFFRLPLTLVGIEVEEWDGYQYINRRFLPIEEAEDFFEEIKASEAHPNPAVSDVGPENYAKDGLDQLHNTSLLLPQVKFAVDRQFSLHGIGTFQLPGSNIDASLNYADETMYWAFPTPFEMVQAHYLQLTPQAERGDISWPQDFSLDQRFREYLFRFFPDHHGYNSLYSEWGDPIPAPSPQFSTDTLSLQSYEDGVITFEIKETDQSVFDEETETYPAYESVARIEWNDSFFSCRLIAQG